MVCGCGQGWGTPSQNREKIWGYISLELSNTLTHAPPPVSHYPTTIVKINGFSWYLVFLILRCPLLLTLFSHYNIMDWNNIVHSTCRLLPGLLSESEVVDSGLSDELLWCLFVFLFGLLLRDRERELELELLWCRRVFSSVLLRGLLLRWESDEYEDDDELRLSLLFLLFLWGDSGDEDERALDLRGRLLTELFFFSRILVEIPIDVWLST